ncbi:ABC transporter ATP-binding protein [Thermococcus thioreducens]|uniref:Iron ABC transporter permease n=1 Tax=Thermococcus thioreducens TaxID=277988 RepID=A0A0Q2QTL0_9EURY|nr:ABC transporter ATP-binding protein [Thermococcus thioreducens]ASJ13235.1 iron ABC transporter permease [Thermococcus thioreducens]KQH83349.1 iron ABC transporter permease [Thermococcus thioreducens]SEW21330.1 iron complex transport system ATP-binding protein [Thermococcus thioreducens]
MKALEVKISFAYGERDVLREVEFTAERGELLAIIGPNGAGKSTLLKCLVGILRPEGRVTFDGTNLLELKPRERAKLITYVPQSSFPEFAFTIEEFVELGTYATKGNVEEALKRVGLWERRNEQITALSGGEYQLALIARALAQGSEVVLLDEPTSHLDINRALEIMELLKGMSRERIVIAVLHDLNLALRYADRLMLLHNGQKHWEGKPEELKPEIIEEIYGVKARIAEVDGHRVLLAGI